MAIRRIQRTKRALVSASMGTVLGIGLSGCQQLAVWMTRANDPHSALSKVSLPERKEAETVAPARVHAQILQEMYRIVLVQNPRSPAEFGNWVDSLNQGASYEGVYAGLTRSSLQRQRELDPKSGALPAATRVFAFQLARILGEFPQAPELTDRDARPLPMIDFGGEDAAVAAGQVKTAPHEQSFKPLAPVSEPTAVRVPIEERAKRLMVTFAGASIFTQKRILGEYALQVMALRQAESVDRLRDWYADFAVALASEKVDFGLPQRNDPSRDFHRRWADRSTEDQLRWEVLNRLHRLLNQAQGIAVQVSSQN